MSYFSHLRQFRESSSTRGYVLKLILSLIQFAWLLNKSILIYHPYYSLEIKKSLHQQKLSCESKARNADMKSFRGHFKCPIIYFGILTAISVFGNCYNSHWLVGNISSKNFSVSSGELVGSQHSPPSPIRPKNVVSMDSKSKKCARSRPNNHLKTNTEGHLKRKLLTGFIRIMLFINVSERRLLCGHISY